ncbi:MAG: hypothetical protein ACFFFH_14540 [Candidatus Thorarchaeota archaeon]
MKLDEDNPCPHCGNIETLTERNNNDFKPVIPKDLQFDFKKGAGAKDNIFIVPSPQEIYGEGNISTNSDQPEPPQSSSILEGPPAPPIEDNNQSENSPTRISQDIPLDPIFPTLENVSLDPASQKVYFQLSIEFQIILNKASNYRQGLFRWNLLLPDRLQEYGLTEEAWRKIATKGDADERIQEQLNRMLRSIFG